MTQPATKGLTTAEAEAERDDAWERFMATKPSTQVEREIYHAELRVIAKREAHHAA